MKRFEEAYGAWTEDRLDQEEAARLLGVCARTFRRYIDRYEEAGLEGLLDKRMHQASHRRAPVDEVMRLVERYRSRHRGWNVKHFHAWYRRDGGRRSYTWVKNTLQRAGAVKRGTRRGAHQDRLVKELAGAGITEMGAANRYLAEVYRPAFNAEFAHPPREEGSAFVACQDKGVLEDILCEHHVRVVGLDNCVRFERRILQIPADRHRCHYMKVKVRVLRYASGEMAIRHGPRELARYDATGQLLQTNMKAAA